MKVGQEGDRQEHYNGDNGPPAVRSPDTDLLDEVGLYHQFE